MPNRFDTLKKHINQIDAVLGSVLEYTDATVSIFDEEGNYLFVNQVVPGLDKEEMLGKPMSDYIPKIMAEQVMAYMDKVKRTGESLTYENSFTGPDGFERTYQHIMSPVRVSDGSIKAITVISTEITELKKNESLLEQQKNELSVQYNQLEDFCHIIAHNLRGPLANLQALHNLLKESKTLEECFELLELHETVLNKFQEVTEDLVTAAQVRSRGHNRKDEICLEELTKQALLKMQKDVHAKHADIQFDFSEVKKLHYSRAFMESILANLISNSLRYSSPDRPPSIRIKSYLENGWICLSVNDNGLGIDLDKHGDKLFKLHKTFHDYPNAKGFGLFMTKTQVEAMGGNIDVQSIPNTGSTFTVKLSKAK